MIRRLILLVVAVVGFWLLLAIPARHLWGDAQAVYAGVTALLCLVPALLTMAWAAMAIHRAPDQQLAAVLGGTGIRMFVVLLAGWGLHSSVDYFREHDGFWVWLLLFYLFTLATEMTLLLAGQSAGPVEKKG